MPRINLYFTFHGRINRLSFVVAHIPLLLVIFAINYAVISTFGEGIPLLISNTLLSIPAASIYVKRWHDIDKSAWHLVTMLIPIINIIATAELFLAAGDAERNEYGEPPNAT